MVASTWALSEAPREAQLGAGSQAIPTETHCHNTRVTQEKVPFLGGMLGHRDVLSAWYAWNRVGQKMGTLWDHADAPGQHTLIATLP